MPEKKNFTGERMREAMDIRRLTSQDVATAMHISDGAIRGWTTGRRKIGIEDLASFAEIVGYPIEYFIKPGYQLPDDFALKTELTQMARQIESLSRKVAESKAVYGTTEPPARMGPAPGMKRIQRGEHFFDVPEDADIPEFVVDAMMASLSDDPERLDCSENNGSA